MVWCEANRAGLYHPKHQPPMYKQYYFPSHGKCWTLVLGPIDEWSRQRASACPMTMSGRRR